MGNGIRYLDGFRGISAFWVLAAHCAIWGVPEISLPLPKIAVDIFMIMSGFLMAYTTMRREDAEPFETPANWLRFYVRRFWRLAPAYYLVLFAAVMLSVPFIQGYTELRSVNQSFWHGSAHDPSSIKFDIANIISHITFVFGLIPQYSSSTGLPDWSLGLEMQFYALFPIVYLAIRRFGHTKVCIPLALISVVFIVLFKKMTGPDGSHGLFPDPSFIFLRLHLFLVGILLCDAFYSENIEYKERWRRCALAIAFVSVQVVFYRLQVLLLLACVFLIIAIEVQAPGSKKIIGILGNKFTKFLADMSYSVYLVHGFFLSMGGAYLYRQPWFKSLGYGTRYFIILSVVTVGSYVLAYFIEKFVERPGIKIGKRLSERSVKSDELAPT